MIGAFHLTFRKFIHLGIALFVVTHISNKLIAQHNELPNYSSYFLKCSSAHKYYSQNEYTKASDA